MAVVEYSTARVATLLSALSRQRHLNAVDDR